MADFLETHFDVVFDGNLTSRELIFVVIAIAILAILIFIVVRIIMGIVRRNRMKKNAIFRGTKNRYKSRLGKKNIKY